MTDTPATATTAALDSIYVIANALTGDQFAVYAPAPHDRRGMYTVAHVLGGTGGYAAPRIHLVHPDDIAAYAAGAADRLRRGSHGHAATVWLDRTTGALHERLTRSTSPTTPHHPIREQEPPMKHTRTPDEDGLLTPGTNPCSDDLVVLGLRASNDPPARILLVRDPARCTHGCTICTECADSWELDHHVHYELSGGGRWLRAALATEHSATDAADS
ncbi:hypothetical protein [Nocardia thailandica]|uniref:hypothetical protein n=1 Tax=Nocardia thailandica TaxID=257275 RepID=UPI00030DBE85|nr:hypothetical protein [Nocardia thailandica]